MVADSSPDYFQGPRTSSFMGMRRKRRKDLVCKRIKDQLPPLFMNATSFCHLDETSKTEDNGARRLSNISDRLCLDLGASMPDFEPHHNLPINSSPCCCYQCHHLRRKKRYQSCHKDRDSNNLGQHDGYFVERLQLPTFQSIATQNKTDSTRTSPLVRLLMILLVSLSTYPQLTFGMSPPPNYSHSNMPVTNFTCADKATGGYYADPEAHCQMFHVCVRISEEEINDFKFLCPNDTVFDQQNFICTNWWEIDCERSTRFYNKNDLFRTESPPEYEYVAPESQDYYEYIYEYVDSDTTAPREQQTTIAPEKPELDTTVHRLNVGKSALHHHHSQPKLKDVSSSTVSSSYYYRHDSSHLTTASPITKDSTTTEKINLFSSRSTASTVAPKITTLRPTHRFDFHFPSTTTEIKMISTTAAPSLEILSSRGRTTGRKVGSIALENTGPQGKLSYDPDGDDSKLNLDSDDPFSIYDWRRDSSGVTASAKTRYETLFFGTSSRGRRYDPSSSEISSVDSSLTPKDSTGQSKNTIRRISRPQTTEVTVIESTTAQTPKSTTKSPPEAKHQEFSNFRFYKTAFGRSYSSDDYLRTGSPKDNTRKNPVRAERTASRNTRYSIYGK